MNYTATSRGYQNKYFIFSIAAPQGGINAMLRQAGGNKTLQIPYRPSSD
jgi:hypothetical protein